jgi:hypothetical protein
MAVRIHEPTVIASGDLEKHPKGLYALFATEMWERFQFLLDARVVHALHAGFQRRI